MNQDQRSYPEVTRADESASEESGASGRAAPNPLLIVLSLLRGRYVLTIVLAGLAAAAGAAAGFYSAQPIYRSYGRIEVKPTLPSLTPTGVDSMMPAFGAFFASQMEHIASERVVMRAMEMLEWQSVRPGVAPPQIAGFRSNLSVASPKGTHLIYVGFTDADPDIAMTAVKCVVTSYLDLYGESDATNNLERLKVYEGIRINEGNRLAALEKSIAVIAGHDVSLDTIHKLYLLSLEETNKREAAWNDVRRILAATDATSASAAPVDSSPTSRPSTLSPEQIALTDRQMQSLLAERRSALHEVRLARVRVGSANPRVIEAQQRLQMIEEDIAAHANNYIAASGSVPPDGAEQSIPGTRSELMVQTLRANERSLRQLHEESAQKTKSLGEKLYRMESLKRDADEAKRKYDEANTAIQRIQLQASFGGRIIADSFGERPLQPFEDKRMKLAGGGAFAGAVLPVAIMLAIGFMNRRIVSVHDARLGIHRVDRMLGVLPHVPTDLADTEQAAVAAHCVHHIRTLLQLEPHLPARRIYSITSPSPGDGKTTLTIALGMSFAASGAKTLLFDCDIIGGGLSSKMDQMIRPKLGRVLVREGLITEEQLQQALAAAKQIGRPLGDVLVERGLVSAADVSHAAAVQAQSYVGLLDVLAGEPLTDCITGTGRPGLFILPIGSAGAHHASQLSPVTLQAILAEARAAFDVVLVDTGPILGSLEAAMVAAQSDGVVLAVSRGVPQALVKRSLDRLLEVGAHVVGMVLNRAATREVADFAFSSGSVRSHSARRLPAPAGHQPEIRLGSVGDAVAASDPKGRR